MSSINDTFNSKKTTPFEGRGARREAFDSKTTTPFEGRGVRREATFDANTYESEGGSSEPRTEPRRPIRWVVIACVGALIGVVLWSTGIGF